MCSDRILCFLWAPVPLTVYFSHWIVVSSCELSLSSALRREYGIPDLPLLPNSYSNIWSSFYFVHFSMVFSCGEVHNPSFIDHSLFIDPSRILVPPLPIYCNLSVTLIKCHSTLFNLTVQMSLLCRIQLNNALYIICLKVKSLFLYCILCTHLSE